jgi:hypothetical protein
MRCAPVHAPPPASARSSTLRATVCCTAAGLQMASSCRRRSREKKEGGRGSSHALASPLPCMRVASNHELVARRRRAPPWTGRGRAPPHLAREGGRERGRGGTGSKERNGWRLGGRERGSLTRPPLAQGSSTPAAECACAQ